jgi:hypothetical protein
LPESHGLKVTKRREAVVENDLGWFHESILIGEVIS